MARWLEQLRKQPAFLLLAAFVVASVLFIACGGDTDSGGGGGGGGRAGADGGGERMSCEPLSVHACRGPAGCMGERSCLASGDGFSVCACTMRPGDASSDSRGDDASNDAPSLNDASNDAPSSNDASDDAPSSNDASDDAPSSNDATSPAPWGEFEILDFFD